MASASNLPGCAGGNIGPSTNKRSRNWVYTNFALDHPVPNTVHVVYHVYQEEICPTTGRHHYQGYIQMSESWTKKRLINNLNDKAFYFIREGTHIEARNYCIKAESRADPNAIPIEYGTGRDDQGARNDLYAVQDKLDQGLSMLEIAQEHFPTWIKYNKSFDKYLALKMKRRVEPPIVIILWGDSGAGKSRYVWDKHGYENVYSKDHTKWWDTYRQQEVVLFDECDYKHRDEGEWCHILDRYPMQVQNKGGYVDLNSKYIYLVSSKRENVVPFLEGDLKRRISDAIKFPLENGVPHLSLTEEKEAILKKELFYKKFDTGGAALAASIAAKAVARDVAAKAAPVINVTIPVKKVGIGIPIKLPVLEPVPMKNLTDDELKALVNLKAVLKNAIPINLVQ